MNNKTFLRSKHEKQREGGKGGEEEGWKTGVGGTAPGAGCGQAWPIPKPPHQARHPGHNSASLTAPDTSPC